MNIYGIMNLINEYKDLSIECVLAEEDNQVIELAYKKSRKYEEIYLSINHLVKTHAANRVIEELKKAIGEE